jgi:hypothetical protein
MAERERLTPSTCKLLSLKHRLPFQASNFLERPTLGLKHGVSANGYGR